MGKDTFYFQHDLNARSDEDIIRLRITAGWEGYGIYWAIIEKMYEHGGPLKDDFDALAFDLKANLESVQKVCNSPGLFYKKRGKLGSHSVDRRMKHRKEVSQARSYAGIQSGKSRTPPEHLLNKCSTKSNKDNIGDDRIGEDRKGKDKKDNTDIGHIIPPKLEWVKAFCLERKNTVDPEKFMAYYESNGWKVGKNPMKSWKAAICGTWEKNNGGFNGSGNQSTGSKHIVGGAAPVPGKYSGIVNK